MSFASVVAASEVPCDRCAAPLRAVWANCALPMMTNSRAGSFVAAPTRTIRTTVRALPNTSGCRRSSRSRTNVSSQADTTARRRTCAAPTDRPSRTTTSKPGAMAAAASTPSGNGSTTRGKSRTFKAASTISRVQDSATATPASLETAASAGPATVTAIPGTAFQETVSPASETAGHGETKARAGMATARTPRQRRQYNGHGHPGDWN